MVPNRFTVMLDTNALYGALNRNIILTLAEAGLYRPRWTSKILEELSGALEPKLGEERVARAIAAIEGAFPEALVEIDPDALLASSLPDPNDNHVLAAAISVRAAQIVTDNIRDFPSGLLRQFDMEAIGVDAFISNSIGLDQITAVSALRSMRLRFDNPALDGPELLGLMEARGLVETASELSDYTDLL